MTIFFKNKIISRMISVLTACLISTSSIAAIPTELVFSPGAGYSNDIYTFNLSGSPSSFAYTSNDFWFLRARNSSGSGEWGVSSDGVVRGWGLGNDMFLVLTGNLNYVNSTGDFGPDGTLSFSFTQNPSGTSNFKMYSGDSCYPRQLCWGMTQYPGGSSVVPVGATLTGSLNGRIYIGPNAQTGTYTIPSLELFSPWNTLSWVTLITPGSVITIEKPPITCSIAPPAQVDFGVIDINGVSNSEQLLAVKNGNLSINCTDGEETSVRVTFSGELSNGLSRKLALKNSVDGTESAANIGGRYLNNYQGTCSSFITDDVYFTGDNPKVINNVGVGETIIPITWSLCSNQNGSLGEGKAQATVSINWD